MFVENFGVQAVVLVVVLLSYLEVRVCNQGFHVVLWRSVPLFRVVGFGCRGGGEEDSFVLLLGGIILYLNTNMAIGAKIVRCSRRDTNNLDPGPFAGDL